MTELSPMAQASYAVLAVFSLLLLIPFRSQPPPPRPPAEVEARSVLEPEPEETAVAGEALGIKLPWWRSLLTVDFLLLWFTNTMVSDSGLPSSLPPRASSRLPAPPAPPIPHPSSRWP